ncbi:hypothetical protein COE20_29505 [Bacillus cereus]|nr:hypothetical protein CON03_18780 [Bacillus cereus]PEC51051.1 hypothetical protein CON05_29220 [Bacillus cereus]PEU75882.1 hypothetical protein CN386_17750 [Bacillus cereus]PFE43477.1 hypothetical protein CN317_22455 [Bacillus cereus]PFN14918.1 hypothetical protein COJ72_13915 [Bacillus cereus]
MHFFIAFPKQYDEKALAARLLSLYAKRKSFSRYTTKI